MSKTAIETNTKTRTSSTQQYRPRTMSPDPEAQHPAAIIQRARAAPESLTRADVLQLQSTIGNQAVGRLLAGIGRRPSAGQEAPIQRQPEPEEEELLQGKFTDECIQCQMPEEEELLQGKMTEAVQRQPEPEDEEELLQGKTLQAQAPPNRTGMPDHLKSGLETLSGMDLSGVRVHYSSSKPVQLNALAYTQGQEIHVAPGQEKHLPHEGWHAVQQMQGRVRPTGEVGGMPLNNSRTLESEADSMGRKALQQYLRVEKPKENKSRTVYNSVAQKKSDGKQGFGFVDNRPEAVTQRKLQEMAKNSPKVKQMRAFQEMANGASAPIQMLRPRSTDITGGNVTGGGAGIIQLKTVTVKNRTNDYSSGWVQVTTRSTGVENGPRNEAQAVAKIFGGTWVGGHMVNDCLGGTGGFENIVPITSSMNNQHHKIENDAQNIVGPYGSDCEVNYRMNILERKDYTFSKDQVKNLAVKFQQHYDHRTKEVQAGGSSSRWKQPKAAGTVKTVDGPVLEMSL